jgi:hypothetical protein
MRLYPVLYPYVKLRRRLTYALCTHSVWPGYDLIAPMSASVWTQASAGEVNALIRHPLTVPLTVPPILSGLPSGGAARNSRCRGGGQRGLTMLPGAAAQLGVTSDRGRADHHLEHNLPPARTVITPAGATGHQVLSI